MHRLALLAVLLLATVLTGCARYPMGLTKADWDALTPGQQARYRQLQENENRSLFRDFEQRSRTTQEKVKDLERRVQVGPDGHSP